MFSRNKSKQEKKSDKKSRVAKNVAIGAAAGTVSTLGAATGTLYNIGKNQGDEEQAKTKEYLQSGEGTFSKTIGPLMARSGILTTVTTGARAAINAAGAASSSGGNMALAALSALAPVGIGAGVALCTFGAAYLGYKGYQLFKDYRNKKFENECRNIAIQEQKRGASLFKQPFVVQKPIDVDNISRQTVQARQ